MKTAARVDVAARCTEDVTWSEMLDSEAIVDCVTCFRPVVELQRVLTLQYGDELWESHELSSDSCRSQLRMTTG